MRRILGLGYVSFVLTWVPYFRHKLFAPLKDSLLADATLSGFRSDVYFSESEVRDQHSGELRPLSPAIPDIQGRIVLVGESGLGKSMFLRHLVSRSQKVRRICRLRSVRTA